LSAPGTDSSDRRRIDEICLAALDRDPPERAEFVRAACGADAALLHEVEALLAHAPAADAFLGASLGAVAAQAMGGGTGQSLVGRTIGTYNVLAAIGAGGMGEVYRARDSKLGRDVAIKVLPAAFTGDRDRLARFEREARVLASLNHPNIAAIYGLEQIGDVQALVLELVEGETLAERIGGRGSGLGVSDALAMARQIAEALEAAHEKGIVHRDLKPANIKVTPGGTVKVLDFGLAKSSAGSAPDLSQSPTIVISGTREGVLLGTAAYMSPEQARGQSVDKRADIWAFGCVLFEMLTGRVAFPGSTVSDHIAAILEREPDWNAVPPATPSTVQRLLRRCLEKIPSVDCTTSPTRGSRSRTRSRRRRQCGPRHHVTRRRVSHGPLPRLPSSASPRWPAGSPGAGRRRAAPGRLGPLRGSSSSRRPRPRSRAAPSTSRQTEARWRTWAGMGRSECICTGSINSTRRRSPARTESSNRTFLRTANGWPSDGWETSSRKSA
jgi:serine/threonine protein kinase